MFNITSRKRFFYSGLCVEYTSENALSVFEDHAVEFHHIHHSISSLISNSARKILILWLFGIMI